MAERNHQRWTTREKYIADRMHREGKAVDQISAALNRSCKSVDGFLRHRHLTFEQKQARAERAYHYRRRKGLIKGTGQVPFRPAVLPIRINLEALAERDYRLSQGPRDLTACLMGDPLPGRSALDRQKCG